MLDVNPQSTKRTGAHSFNQSNATQIHASRHMLRSSSGARQKNASYYQRVRLSEKSDSAVAISFTPSFSITWACTHALPRPVGSICTLRFTGLKLELKC